MNLDINNLSKSFYHVPVFQSFSISIKSGERVGLFGPNGSGKTTLLKILSRISSPTKGSIKIKGRVASLIAIGTGFHSELTGKENIYLNLHKTLKISIFYFQNLPNY